MTTNCMEGIINFGCVNLKQGFVSSKNTSRLGISLFLLLMAIVMLESERLYDLKENEALSLLSCLSLFLNAMGSE